MNETNTVMLVIFAALGVMLVALLLAIPAIDHVQAKDGRITNPGKHLGQQRAHGPPPWGARGC
jgi:hypothetical protein